MFILLQFISIKSSERSNTKGYNKIPAVVGIATKADAPKTI